MKGKSRRVQKRPVMIWKRKRKISKTPIAFNRKIFIKEFEITGIESPIVRFRVVCAAGVYIRSLAHDMGAELGCGAYLSSLCRTRIGDFLLKQSLTIEDAENEIRSKLRNQKG